MKSTLSFLLLFIYILQPQFVLFPFSQSIELFFFLFFALMYRNSFLNIISEYKIIFSIYIILAFWSLFLSLIYNAEILFFGLMLKIIFYMFFSIFFLNFIKIGKKNEFNYLIKLLLNIIIFNSIIILLEFLFPEINSYIESLLHKVGNIDFATEGMRLRGLSSGGGAALAVLNAIGFLFVLYLRKIKNITIVKSIVYIIVILISLLFIGRTGYLLITIILIYYIFYDMKKQVSLIIYSIVILLFSIYLFQIYFPDRYEYFMRYVYSWAFEFFLSTSNLELTKSNADLLTMYHLPTNPFDLLIGYGFFDGPFNILKRSDAGYIKTITSIGLFGSMIFYGTILFLMFKTYVKNKNIFYSLLLPLYIIIFIAELKEPFIYQQYSSRVLFILLVTPSVLRQINTRKIK